MEAFLFIVIALMAIGSALMVITQRSPINSVLYLVIAFFCLAVLYVMLGAQMVAAFQVIVYAGAIMVLFVFVVMMLNLSKAQEWERIGPIRRWLGFAAAAGVLLVVVTALRDQSEQRERGYGFARTRLANYTEYFAFFNIEINAINCFCCPGFGVKVSFQPFYFD